MPFLKRFCWRLSKLEENQRLKLPDQTAFSFAKHGWNEMIMNHVMIFFGPMCD